MTNLIARLDKMWLREINSNLKVNYNSVSQIPVKTELVLS